MSFKTSYKIYLLLLGITLLFYGNSIKNEYALDNVFVTANPVTAKGIRAIPEIFTSWYYTNQNMQSGYRPIAKSSFAIEYSLFGEKPHISHFINLILYWVACCLLFRALILLFGSASILFSFIVCVLFLMHPLHTEVVCSLKNRENILSFIGAIASLIFFLQYTSSQKIQYLLLGILAYLFSQLSKEDSLVYFFIIPFSLFYFKKAGKGQLMRIIAGLFLGAQLFTAIMAIFLYYHKSELRPFVFYENPLFFDHSFFGRLSMGFYSLEYYVRLLFFPSPLICYYGYSHVTLVGWNDLRVIVSAVLSIAMLVYCIINFKKRNLFVYGMIFYVAAISMFLNFVTPVTGMIAERHAFNASLGFCIVLSVWLFKLFKIDPYNPKLFNLNFFTHKKWFTASLLSIFLLYFGITFQRNRDWKDFYTLCKADLVHAPNSAKIHVLIAQILTEKFLAPGKERSDTLLKQAMFHYDEALRIYPKLAEPLNNKGLILSRAYSKCNEAIPCFKQAIEADSTFAEAYYNLAFCYNNLKNPREAELNYLKAIRFYPLHVHSYHDLTELYINSNRTDEAIRLNKSAIEKGLKHADFYLNLGYIYMLQQDTLNAISCYESSLKLNSDNQQLCEMLSNYYARKNNPGKAGLYKKMAEESVEKNKE